MQLYIQYFIRQNQAAAELKTMLATADAQMIESEVQSPLSPTEYVHGVILNESKAFLPEGIPGDTVGDVTLTIFTENGLM